jgi:hypothetical protein
MEFIGILFALFIAMALTLIFALILRNTGPWGGFWTFFVLLFFIALGAGEWAAPRGPSAWGYYWVPGLVSAFILALMLAAASPGSKKKYLRNRKKYLTEKEGDKEEEAVVTAVVISSFFWVLLLVLVLIAGFGLLTRIQ